MTNSAPPAAPAPLDPRCREIAIFEKQCLRDAGHEGHHDWSSVGAVQAEHPREPSDAALQAAVDSFAFRDTSKIVGTAGPWVPHHIVDAVRAAYAIDFGALPGAPNEETKHES